MPKALMKRFSNKRKNLMTQIINNLHRLVYIPECSVGEAIELKRISKEIYETFSKNTDCLFCELSFERYSTFQLHMLYMHKVHNLKCIYCKCEILDANELHSHVEECHEVETNNNLTALDLYDTNLIQCRASKT